MVLTPRDVGSKCGGVQAVLGLLRILGENSDEAGAQIDVTGMFRNLEKIDSIPRNLTEYDRNCQQFEQSFFNFFAALYSGRNLCFSDSVRFF